MTGTSTIERQDLHCVSCAQDISLAEVFDAWETPGADREACPRCQGRLLSPLG